MSEPERERFEAWIAGPPYERDTSRYPGSYEQTAWPGQYVDLAVQLAWEAWAEAAPGWTLVAEGLPAEGVPVLVSRLGEPSPRVGWRDREDGEWWIPGEGFVYPEAITHWRPLPPRPPEAGEDP
jgi:hypothetical protein